MPSPVCDGARMECSLGVGEVRLRTDKRGVRNGGGSQGAGGSSASGGSALGTNESEADASGADGSLATVDDCTPLVHIGPFRGCSAQANSNPVLPNGHRLCTPRPLGQWSAEIKCMFLQEKKLVELRATLRCTFGGTIRFVDAGQEGIHVESSLLENPSIFGDAGGLGGSDQSA